MKFSEIYMGAQKKNPSTKPAVSGEKKKKKSDVLRHRFW